MDENIVFSLTLAKVAEDVPELKLLDPPDVAQ
jgi:hypothetical protein